MRALSPSPGLFWLWANSMGLDEDTTETDPCWAPGWRGDARTGQNNPFSRVETEVLMPVKSIPSRRLWGGCPAVAALTVIGPTLSAYDRSPTMLLAKSEKST
jgi:hypothetical protein